MVTEKTFQGISDSKDTLSKLEILKDNEFGFCKEKDEISIHILTE